MVTDWERRFFAKKMRKATPAPFGATGYSVDMGDGEHPLYIVGESEHALRGALGYLAKLIEPERTCHVVSETKRISQTQVVTKKSCSCCGYEFGAEMHNEILDVTINVPNIPNYCPD